MCIYTYSSQYRDAGRAKEIKKIFGQQWMLRAKEIFPRVILSTRAKGSSALVYRIVGILASGSATRKWKLGENKEIDLFSIQQKL
jgi:hypothetical protein